MTGRDEDDWSAMFSALASDQRRALVQYLTEAGDRTTVAEVVDHLLDGDRGSARDERTRLITKLHHVHLPKLDAVGVVEFDPERRTVEKGPALDAAVELVIQGE